MKIVFLAASLLACAAICAAQEPKSDFKISEITNDAGGLNVTSLRLEPMPLDVPGAPAARVELTSDFTYGTQGGKAFVLPAGLNLTFHDPKIKFPRPPDVTLAFDGVRLKFRGVTETPTGGNISADMVGEGIAASGGRRGVEEVYLLLPAKTFAALAKARAAEVRIGELSVPLREDHLKALREMLGRSEGKKARPN